MEPYVSSTSIQQTEEIDRYLFLLQDLIEKILEKTENSLVLKKRFGQLLRQGYGEGLQLPKGYLALISHLLQLEEFSVHPQQLPNGTTLLDSLGWCESREIPEPIEHAQLGVLWMILGIRLRNEVLQRAGLKIAVWQVHLLDPQGNPHLSLWSRAYSFRPSMLCLWNYALFTIAHQLVGQNEFHQLAEIARAQAWDPHAFPVKLLQLVSSNQVPILQQFRPFAEEMTVGMIKFSTPEVSLVAHVSGWNSGLFSFHKKEVSLVNGGPQVGPYDALDKFGICRTWGIKDRPFQDIVWEKTAYHCRLKGWTRLLTLPLWLELDVQLQAGQATVEVKFEEKITNASSLSIILFLKCSSLVLGGKYHLESEALEGYEGKSVPIELQGSQEKMLLCPSPHLPMQVIPLAGGDHFWGASFLVAFPLEQGIKMFKLEIK